MTFTTEVPQFSGHKPREKGHNSLATPIHLTSHVEQKRIFFSLPPFELNKMIIKKRGNTIEGAGDFSFLNPFLTGWTHHRLSSGTTAVIPVFDGSDTSLVKQRDIIIQTDRQTDSTSSAVATSKL